MRYYIISKPSSTVYARRQVLQKVKDNNLTIGKADKGNIITIDSKDNIIKKTNTFLENPIYMKLKSDPK